VARRTDDLFERFGRLVDDNDEAVSRTVRNVERFSQALGDNADGVNRTLASIAGAAERVGPLAEQLETLSRNLNGMIAQVDIGSVNRTLTNVEQFSQALGGNAEGVSRMLATVTSAAERIGPLAEQLERFSRDIARVGAAVDPERVGRTLENVDRFAAALAGGSGDVTKTLQSVASLTDKLNRAADQVESVLRSAQSFLGSASGGEGQGALAEVGSAARSIRTLADNLDKRTAEITAGVSRFTGPGLRDIEALASDGRRTLNDINRTLRNIERNPQQLIFGGRPAIPDYQGRR
jgi:phospholipid/cholesterol/gamma-HCH transport system substrate-binding protein